MCKRERVSSDVEEVDGATKSWESNQPVAHTFITKEFNGPQSQRIVSVAKPFFLRASQCNRYPICYLHDTGSFVREHNEIIRRPNAVVACWVAEFEISIYG